MRKKVFLLFILAIFAVLLVSNFITGSVDEVNYQTAVYSTVFSLLPPIIAIILALITKEVYSSLFIGIVTGAVLYANGNLEFAIQTIFFNSDGGMVTKLSDSWNVGILLFLVMLGILISLMNKAGGSAAFGNWATHKIKNKKMAQLATVILGVLIFVDDYFNCLTVGSVMRPITDRNRVSRAKLAYLIDATAAPICIISPISSWAAAVTSSVPENSDINGFTMFLKTIPYNFYAICMLIMVIYIIATGLDFGLMLKHEINAENGDLLSQADENDKKVETETKNSKGKVIDLVLPVGALIFCCITGMLYTGGFFNGENFIDAFANSDASVGLVLGSFVTIMITFFFYMLRDVLSFSEFMDCVSEGFKAMVSPMIILTMAWTLSGMTNLLGAKFFVAGIVGNSSPAIQLFLPAIIFATALFLAFSTGTSWGTFSIFVPIICSIFGSGEMLVICISSCLSGAVCGDHCSPISDTTIMASAGADCNHINHVSTQLPYVLTVAVIAFIGYIFAGFIQNVVISLIFVVALLLIVLNALKIRQKRKMSRI